MNEYLGLTLVSAIISVVVQFTKSMTMVNARLLVIGLSIAAGGTYYLVQNSVGWDAMLKILLIANGIYGLIISNFEA